MKKTLTVIVGALLVLGGAWYLFSVYLVSKLDGSGGVQAPQSGLTAFESAEFGLAFQYPNTYDTVIQEEGNAERSWQTLVLLPVGYVPPEGGEGPATITIQKFPNPEGLSLEQWVRGDARSNWKLIVDERASRDTTVAGEPALWYHYSALYENDSVAVAYGDTIYIFTVAWLSPEETIRKELNALLSTVSFR
jgi:predicted Zn-dependent protease